MNEHERIQSVYGGRDKSKVRNLYAWHRPEVRRQDAERALVAASLLYDAVGDELSGLKILDVGCGKGEWIRRLVEWGADPAKITGTELLPDRLEVAKVISPQAIKWHYGDLSSIPSNSMDLVTANTVFSSILDDEVRRELASEIARVLAPGGWVMVFDFRYNNPKNSNVRRVTRGELDLLWPEWKSKYQTLLLAPPVARKISKLSFLSATLSHFVPVLRSHFIYMAQK